MEVADARPRALTLSDQLAVPDSPDLRDLLKTAHTRPRRPRRNKPNPAPSAAARTLLDILREDQPRRTRSRWPTLESVLASDVPQHTDTLEFIISATVSEPNSGNTDEDNPVPEEQPTPTRVSLMALLEQSEWHGGHGAVQFTNDVPDLGTGEEEGETGTVDVANAWLCCVCMVRNKGAAFIPCGHTFCRGCSRELLARRGSCPLCNAGIDDVLDIY